MNLTLKNIKNKNKLKKTIKTNINLKGGKNFIDYLFNVESDEICTKDNSKDININKELQLDQNSKEIQKKINSSQNILNKWIENTNPQKGMVLYFVTENNKNDSEEKNDDKGWLQGFHGNALENDYKLHFNDYIKEKLTNTDNSKYKKCLNEPITISNTDCQNSLTEIQIDDIQQITERIETNNKVNNYLFQWLEFNKTFIQNQEKELLEKVEKMKKDLNDKKQKIKDHTTNINILINKNLNYNKIIKEYINPDPNYEKLKNIDKDVFEIQDNLIKYISFSLQDHKEGELNKDFNI